MIKFRVDEDLAGQRLDAALVEKLADLSRSSIQKLCASNKIFVNGKPAAAKTKLKAGDKITVHYDDDNKIPEIDLPIIYEDADCLVVDKPAGVLSHSKGAFNPEATVATFLQKYVTGMEGERAGIVHRLDRATSGVMICAKTPEALSWLQKQFSQRKVKKTYIAIAGGNFEQKHAIIDMPIERNPKKPQTFRAGVNGKPAITEYEVIESGKTLSLVKLMPQTGRTHQLRVHLLQLGYPILGDMLYGGQPASRLFLHAEKLEITLPSRERKIFNSPLPSNFERTIKEDG